MGCWPTRGVPSAQAWTCGRPWPAGGRPLPEAGFAGFVERPPAKPLIAAVEGAVAGGFELILARDLVVVGGTRGSGCLSTAPADRGRGRACYGCPAGAVLPGGRMGADRRSCPRRRREGSGSDQPTRAGRRGDCGRGSTCREDRAQRPLAIAATNRVLTESADWAAAEAFAQQRDQLAGP